MQKKRTRIKQINSKMSKNNKKQRKIKCAIKKGCFDKETEGETYGSGAH